MPDARQQLISYLHQQKELLMPPLYLSLPLTLGVRSIQKSVSPTAFKVLPAQSVAVPQQEYLQKQILASPSVPGNNSTKREALVALYESYKNCVVCTIASRRKKFIFGSGNAQAAIMIIGDAPSEGDEEKGEPFSGPEGELLTKMLLAIGLNRKTDTFITTSIKCRPPANREATPEELTNCTALCKAQIAIIKPKILLLLGRMAAMALLGKKDSISVMRLQTHAYEGIAALVTYHPTGLLKNSALKRPTWEDLQKFEKLYKELGIHAST